MAIDLDIQLTVNGDRGRYWADLGEGDEAEMTYLRRPDGSIIITHTGVPFAFEGRGIALQLVKRAVADARGPAGQNRNRLTPLVLNLCVCVL